MAGKPGSSAASNGTHFRVENEPMTYRRGGEFSYFQDRWNADQEDDKAEARLQRHEVELRTVGAERELRAMQGPGYEVRVTPNWTPGTGGYFAPPLWLIEEFANVPRAERIVAALAPNFRLPKGAQTINLPRLTEGPVVHTSSLNAVVDEVDIADQADNTPVVTISGKQDVPNQLLEQSPLGAHLDWVIFNGLKASYEEQLDYQLVIGSGARGETLGLINVSGINTVTYTEATPKAILMYPYIGQVYAASATQRKLHPEAWLMRGARWAWMCVGEDEEKRPLGLPDAHNPPPTTPDGVPDPIGGLIGAPVFGEENIPTTLNGNQDTIIGFRPKDLMVFESDPITTLDRESLSGALMVRLTMHSFVAGIIARYPSGIGIMTGTGMVPAEHF